jgi:hypothetical protein
MQPSIAPDCLTSLMFLMFAISSRESVNNDQRRGAILRHFASDLLRSNAFLDNFMKRH